MPQSDRAVLARDHIDVEELFLIFDLQDNGDLIWRRRSGSTKDITIFNVKFAGKVAGSVNAHGYKQVVFRWRGLKFCLLQHCIVWAMTHGFWLEGRKLDHEDNVRTNNRSSNIRRASDSQNAYNSMVRSDNISGFKGVSFQRNSGLWHARLYANKACVLSAYHKTAKEAARAYDAAALKHHGEFAKTNAALGLL
ncbi:HNH endonuclease [Rhizobium sp.]|uniref:HNH endonuclease n=1 Tax=Rhizobium sp. TaxID=391 RepID=UPI0028A8CAAF